MECLDIFNNLCEYRVRQAKWEKYDFCNINENFEQTNGFRTNFINTYLFIYTLRAFLLAQKPPKMYSPLQV